MSTPEISRRLISGDWKTVAAESSDATAVAVLKRTVVLTDAQIKALPSADVEIVPAPGAGMGLLHIATYFKIDRTGGDYGNIDDDGAIGIHHTSGSIGYIAFNESAPGILTSFLSDVSHPEFVGVLPVFPTYFAAGFGIAPSFVYPDMIENLPLSITADNGGLGDYSGGDSSNSFSLTTIYAIVEV